MEEDQQRFLTRTYPITVIDPISHSPWYATKILSPNIIFATAHRFLGNSLDAVKVEDMPAEDRNKV